MRMSGIPRGWRTGDEVPNAVMRLDDPRLSRSVRRPLLARLAMYAQYYAEHNAIKDRTPEEILALVIEWYEIGQLKIVPDGDGVIIGPCFYDGVTPIDTVGV
jgi:hypothetical protein